MRKFFLILVGCFWILSLFGQTQTFYEQGYKVEHYGVDYGFKFDEIFDIYQAKNGYLWMSNYSHIARFDGHEFKFYRPKEKDRTNDGGDYMRGVTEDAEGNIWISTIEKEIWKFNPNTEQFTKHKLGEQAIQNRRRGNMVTDSLGQMWLGGDNGLFQINAHRDSFHVLNYSMTSQKNLGIKNRRVIPFLDNQQQLWVNSDKGDLLKINPSENKKQAEVMMSWEKAPWRYLYGITQFDEENLLLFYYKKTEGVQNALALLNIHTYKITELKTGLDKKSWFTHLKKDVTGNIWLGSIQNGLYLLKPPFIPLGDKGEPNLSYFDVTQKDSIRGDKDFIFSLKFDNNDNLWVGTRMNFLYKIDTKQEGLSFVDFQQYGYQNEQELTTLWRDKADNIWVAGHQRLMRFNSEIEDFTFFDMEVVGKPILGSLFIFSEQEDTIYLGAGPKILAYSKNTKKVQEKEIIGFPKKVEGMILEYYELDEKAHFLSIGVQGSVPTSYLYDSKKQLIHHTFSNLSTPLLEGNDLWLAGVNQIFKYDIKEETLDTFHSPHAPLTIFKDSKDNIWLGSDAGLGLVNESTKTIKHYNEEHGLTSIMVAEILEHKGYLWIFTFKGIFRFDPIKEQFDTFGQLDGIGKLRYAIGIDAVKDKDDNFWILGEKGLFTFNPDELIPDLKPPQVIISNLTVNQKLVITKTNLGKTMGMLDFPYFKNNFEIDYVGIHLDNPKQNTYQYILEGHQSDWQNIGTDRTARFSNLSSGSYTFKVKAANADGIWSEPKALKITIHPPWWQTWWAYLIYALSFIGVLAYWYRSLQHKLKKEQAHNEALQTLNLELKDINTANQRFVPNDFLQILGKKSIKDLQLGDQVAIKMTILFSDIRDYTPLSESMTPEQNFKFINAYLGRIGPIIKAHGGFISSYLGDGLMALFVNEPQNAIAATIAMQKELEIYNQERKATGKRALRTGMGLNTGDLMLGVIGDEHRYESTVISDAVNTASRMEGLTKVFGAAIILSERTLLGLRGNFPLPHNFKDEEADVKEKLRGNGKSPCNPDFAYRYLGKVKVKGKDKALKIYDLYEGGTVAIRELKAQTKLHFEQGIDYYFNRQFGKAAECFKQVLVVNENDKAANYYLEKSVHYIVNEVAENWSGVEEMMIK